MLNEERVWHDQGTGHVSPIYVDKLSGLSLIVRSETDSTLLPYFILGFLNIVRLVNVNSTCIRSFGLVISKHFSCCVMTFPINSLDQLWQL